MTESKKALSWSSLKYIYESPMLYRYRIDHPEPPKAHFTFGGAAHCLILEPEKFRSRYALCEVKRDKRHRAYQEWLQDHECQEALSQREWDTVHMVRDAVFNHKVARKIIESSRKEVRLEWDDPDTGLSCRARIDIIGVAIGELKTTTDPAARPFAADAARNLYHGQLSMYQTGAVTLGIIDPSEMPYVIPVAKEPPFDVAVYRMKPEDLHAGRQVVLAMMRRLEECMLADYWPGVAPDLLYLDLPPWAAGLREESDTW